MDTGLIVVIVSVVVSILGFVLDKKKEEKKNILQDTFDNSRETSQNEVEAYDSYEKSDFKELSMQPMRVEPLREIIEDMPFEGDLTQIDDDADGSRDGHMNFELRKAVLFSEVLNKRYNNF